LGSPPGIAVEKFAIEPRLALRLNPAEPIDLELQVGALGPG
jgi:hypothetical protein